MNVRGGRKQAQKRLEMKQFWEGANGVVSGRGLKIMEQWGYSWEKGGLGDGKGRWGIGHFPDRWAQAPCPPALNALTAAMILASSSPPPPPPPNLLLPTPNLLLPPPTPCPTPFTVAPPKMSVPQLRHQRLFVPITTTTYLPPPCPPPPDHNNNNNNTNNNNNNNQNKSPTTSSPFFHFTRKSTTTFAYALTRPSRSSPVAFLTASREPSTKLDVTLFSQQAKNSPTSSVERTKHGPTKCNKKASTASPAQIATKNM